MNWSQRSVIGFLGFALSWGLFQQAAKEPQSYYRLFLLITIPLLIAILTVPRERLQSSRSLLGLLVLVILLGGILVQPALEGRGWVVLFIGVASLWITLVVGERSPTARRAMFLLLIIIGSVEALAGLIQSLGAEELAQGTFTNRNHFAGLLNMTIALAFGGLFANYASLRKDLRSETYARAWVILLSCAFMGLGVFLSLSRAGSISLILVLLLTAILLSLSPRRGGERRLAGSVAWILLATTMALGAWVGVDGLIQRFGVVDEVRNQRWVVYQDTLRMIGEHPWLGVGLGMYEWRFRPFQTTDATLWWRHAHNDYLETMAEWGVPLALCFWGFVIWRWGRSVRLFFSAQEPWRKGMALGCAGAIFSILVHSLVDFNLQMPANWMVFGSILGLAWGLDQGDE